MMLFFTLLLALLFLSIVLHRLYISYAFKFNILDVPNARSSHDKITPRGGGLVIVTLWFFIALIALACKVWSLKQALVFFPGAFLVALISFWDDRDHVPARWRALIHFIAAILSIIALGKGTDYLLLDGQIIFLGLGGTILAVLSIAWSINLFNFMDGIDGLAGVEAFFVFGMGGALLWHAGGHGLAVMSWAIVACVLGFLIWNWPPAKLFMGDVGSAFLGFLVVPFAISGQLWYGVPALIWLILYGVFVFDATVTLCRRILAKERWYEAHREHAFQRLYRLGWNKPKILGAVIITNIILSGLAALSVIYPNFLMLFLFFMLLILLLLYLIIEYFNPMFTGQTIRNNQGKLFN